jgi:hypothetical protein
MTEIPAPPAPRSVEETGIEPRLLMNLLTKMMYVQGLGLVSRLSEGLRLPPVVVQELVEEARGLQLVQSMGSAMRHEIGAEIRWGLTQKGQEWATEAMSLSHYIGPAPVTLEAYHAQVERQRIALETIDHDRLIEAFAHLVLPEGLLRRLGPAINSAKSIFLYGPSGNGKTSIAEAMGRAFRDTIWLPHCIDVDGQIINYYDETVHRRAEAPPPPGADPRWVPCRRPVTLTGGELTLEMLDLIFNPNERFFEAPVQLKAIGGVLIIDDFGRQRVDPGLILNRWIVPLERGIDYLSLHTGKKFPVPFDALVVFATNLVPRDITDEATLRRLYYKIEVCRPTPADYRAIFEAVCAERGIELPPDIVPYLLEEVYAEGKAPIAGYHPRYLVDQVAALCHFESRPVRLDRESLKIAWQNLFAT